MTDWYYKKLGSAGASGAIFDKDGNELISLLTPEEAKLILDLRESHHKILRLLHDAYIALPMSKHNRDLTKRISDALQEAEKLTGERL